MDDRFDQLRDDNPYRSFKDSVESPAEVPPEAPEDSWLSPFRTIWTSPRKTIRQIVATDPELHVLLLIGLAGMSESLDRASTRFAGDKMPLGVILAVACVFGPLGGLFGMWIYSHLIRISGNWLEGRGDYEEIKSAIAWSSVPHVTGLAIWIALILLLGHELFTKETPYLDAHPTLALVVLALFLAQMVLALWSMVLLCNTVAEVQGYRSAWRGLANLFLAGALLAVPLFILGAGLFFLFAE